MMSATRWFFDDINHNYCNLEPLFSEDDVHHQVAFEDVYVL